MLSHNLFRVFTILILILCALQMRVNAQCNIASIGVNQDKACVPTLLKFVVNNLPKQRSYTWHFDNTSVSGSDTLYKYFDDAQKVNVKVTIIEVNGDTCSLSKSNITALFQKPIPKIGFVRTTLCDGPDTLTLIDNTPLSALRNWIVDGTNYNNASPTVVHKFTTVGSKSIALAVTDKYGCLGVTELKNAILVSPKPKIDISPNWWSGCAPQDVTYSLALFGLNKKNIDSLAWKFPKSSNPLDTGFAPKKCTYSAAGVYDASIKIFTNFGCTYILNKEAIVKFGGTFNLNLKPSKNKICIKEPITFSLDQSLNGTFQWDFTGVNPVSVDTSKRNSVTVVFADTGTATLTVTLNQNGCISKKVFKNLVRINGVLANFSSSNNFHCLVPHTVNLKNNSNSFSAYYTSYDWLISQNGNKVYSTTAKDPTFTFYKLNEEYDVRLAVRTSDGCVDTLIKKGFIYQKPLKVEFFLDPTIACLSQSISTINNTKPSTYLVPDNFEWTFYDLDSVSILKTSAERSPRISYNALGFYNVKLVGYNSLGCKDSILKKRVVEIVKPELKYTVDNDFRCEYEPFLLTGLTEPTRANFTHKFTFRHKQTGVSTDFIGRNQAALLPSKGRYTLIYTHQIGNGCIDSAKRDVFVNGLEFDIVLDTLDGCAPLLVNSQFNLKANFDFLDTAQNFIYTWDASPKSFLIKNQQKLNAEYQFLENEDYTIRGTAVNKSGCVFSNKSELVLTGVRSRFNILNRDNLACFGSDIKVINTAYNKPDSFAWKIEPSVPFSIKNKGDTTLIFVKKPGIYNLSLEAYRDQLCADTFKSIIKIQEVIARFSASDSLLSCAPVYAEFKSYSQNADSLLWDFGDGQVGITTLNTAGNIYQKNSGFKKGFDIKLIAKSVYGCTDTLEKKNYTVVAGPVPSFEMSNILGCEPLDVAFKNTSTDSKSYLLIYGDGAKSDKDSFINYLYSNSLESITPQFYKPQLIATDSLGCQAFFSPDSVISVLKTPKISFATQLDKAYCVPSTIVAKVDQHYADNLRWMLDGNLISTTPEAIFSLSLPRTSTLQFRASNSNCSDTIISEIIALGAPNLEIEIESVKCDNSEINLIARSSDTAFITRAEWYVNGKFLLEGTSIFDTSTFVKLDTFGNHTIKLWAQTFGLCVDSFEKIIRYYSVDDIEIPQINYVSFLDNYTLDVNYTATSMNRFGKYVLLENEVGIAQKMKQLEDSFTRKFAAEPLSPSCYSIQIQDNCELNGKLSDPHCFVYLAVNQYGNAALKLDWTPYKGWTAVQFYEIYRKKENENSFEKIGQVSGTINTFIDTLLCNYPYTYKVKAVHPSDINISSFSFEVTKTPNYILPSKIVDIKTVSVLNNKDIEIKLHEVPLQSGEEYSISKYATDTTQILSTFYTNRSEMIDHEVDVQSLSYIYKAQLRDHCLNKSNFGLQGKSILLSGYYSKGAVLNWTPYELWKNGVKQYQLFLMNNNSEHKIFESDATTLSYLDEKFRPDITSEYCYQVLASNEFLDSSYSNIFCASSLPLIILPTAFTPNSDNLNENFKPIVQFISTLNYEFVIFNRWGEIIFSTTDLKQGWDGSLRGGIVPNGVYAYKIKANDLKQNKINLTGTVHIIR